MSISITDLAQAREAAAQILEELGLEAYLFEIQPRDEQWELTVESAIDAGWERFKFPINQQLLIASRSDNAIRQQLLEAWRAKLAQCRRHAP